MGVVAEPYAPGLGPRWDCFVRTSRIPHFLFERAYMDYHADRFNDASVVVHDGDRLRSILPASRHGDTVVSHGGLTFGGLITDHSATLANCRDAFSAILALFRSQGVQTLTYKAVPHIYHRGAAEEDLILLHEFGARLASRDISAAVAPGPRPAMRSGRRYAIRKGEAAGFDVSESNQIEEYMTIVAELLKARHGIAPVHTPAEMRLLADRFPDNIRLWTATHSGGIASGYLVYETPMVAHVQYIAARPDARDHGAGDVVANHLITKVYADRWFDFGTSNERDGTVNHGLLSNKEGFGARAVAYDHYVVNL